MATPKVFTAVTSAWQDLVGGAASTAGVTWQNVGSSPIYIAFTTAAPAGGATDAFHVLDAGTAYYDKNGSTHCWAKCPGGAGTLTATAD